MVLNKINNTAPTTGSGKATVINPGFTAAFTHLLFEVVNAPTGTIPANLQPYFGSAGWACAPATVTPARKDLKNYGFLSLPTGGTPGTCGFSSPPPPSPPGRT